jgi:hypothetical protein
MQIKLGDVHAGDRLVADGGFTCLYNGEILTVESDEGGLFVRCAGPRDDQDYGKPRTIARNEKHYLDGQENDDGELVGLRRSDR